MGVICFTSLKGGVGKTSLAINAAASFAARGGETLLIDLDPTAHTTRFFLRGQSIGEAPLPRLCLNTDIKQGSSLVEYSLKQKINLLREVRERLVLMPGGAELRHCTWGKGAHRFKSHFAELIRELKLSFDYIVIDTPPDFSVHVRNAIAVSDLAVVPIDGSAMSIDCLNQLLSDAGHIEGPQWAIVRSMVSKRASRLNKISDKHMRTQVEIKSFVREQEGDEFTDDDDISTLQESSESAGVYLLDSLVHRTEEQNKLTFSGKTAQEVRQCANLNAEYVRLARELDALLIVAEENKNLLDEPENNFDITAAMANREPSDNGQEHISGL